MQTLVSHSGALANDVNAKLKLKFIVSDWDTLSAAGWNTFSLLYDIKF